MYVRCINFPNPKNYAIGNSLLFKIFCLIRTVKPVCVEKLASLNCLNLYNMKSKSLFIFRVLLFCCMSFGAAAQSYEGTAYTFGYNVSGGNLENFNNVLNESRTRYPYFTDNSDFSNKKQGFSFGVNIVEENTKFIDGSIGGINASAWSCGHAPTGMDVCETYLVKSRYINLSVGRYFFNKPGIRFGSSIGLSLNFVSVKSSSASRANERAKADKYVFIIGGSEVSHLQNSFFTGLDCAFPFAIGKKYAFGLAPYFTLPFWRVNSKNMRRVMMPNSSPLLDPAAYKGWMAYAGLRFTMSIGEVKL